MCICCHEYDQLPWLCHLKDLATSVCREAIEVPFMSLSLLFYCSLRPNNKLWLTQFCDPHTKCIIDVGLMSIQLFSSFKIQTVVDQSDYSIWSHDPL